MWRVARWQEWSPGTWRVSNPAPGARIYYYLKEDAPLPSPTVDARRDDGGGRSGGRGGGRGGANQMPPSVPTTPPEPTVKLTVLDGNGGFVREFEGPGRAGVQTALWDFRIADAYATTGGGFGGGGRRGGGGGPRGPEVLPGTYTVRLEAGGQMTETTIEVVLDPRIQVPMDVLRDRQDAMMDAYNLAKPAYEARQALAAINEQLNNMSRLLGDDSPDALTTAFDDIKRDVGEIQQSIQEAVTGAGGVNTIQSFAGEPTADQLWQIDQSWMLLPGVIDQINVVITDRMPGLIAMVYQPGVGPAPLDTIEIPTRSGR